MQIGWATIAGSRPVFVALLGLAMVVRVGFVVNAVLDPDESQHLQAAWLVGRGAVPFRDFWEHHTPVLYYLLAPLTHGFAESPAVYFAARSAMTLAAAGALWVVHRLARRISPSGGMAAVVMLATLPGFLEGTTEVRPDAPALVVWLWGLLALVNWGERGRPGWLWLAGLAQGSAMTLTPKAAYGALGVALAVVGVAATRGPRRAHRVVLSLARLALGTAAPLLGLLGGLWLAGGSLAVSRFFEQAVRGSLQFEDFTKTEPVSAAGVGFLVLAIAGLVLTVRRQGWAALRHPLHGSLLPLALAVTALLLLPRTPAVYAHTWLPVLAVASVYAGMAVSQSLEWAQGARRLGPTALAVGVVLGGVVLPAAGSIRGALLERNEDQLRVMRLQLMHACPGEPVLDGTALYVFRPAAYRYRVLIRGVRLWVARGVIPEEEIERDLAQARARVAYPDSRLRAMVGPVAAFLAQHYVPTPEGLLVAGVTIRVPDGPDDGRAGVDLLVTGLYRLTAHDGIEVAIDGVRRRRGWVELGAGRHEITWTGGLAGTVGLVAATCPERRALTGPGSNRLTVP